MSREKSKFKFKPFQGFCYWLFSPPGSLFRYRALILHLIHGANMAVEYVLFQHFMWIIMCI